jgi:hypothetical protein
MATDPIDAHGLMPLERVPTGNPRPRHYFARRLSQSRNLHPAGRTGDGQDDLRKPVLLQSCRRRALRGLRDPSGGNARSHDAAHADNVVL